MTVIIGVDPGITGAACAIRIDDMGEPEFMEMFDCPSEPIGTKRRVHVEVLGNWLEKIEPDLAIIENVHNMPKEGSSSSFRFGGTCEAIRTSVALYRIRYRMVAPQTWKPTFHLRGSDKEASRKKAIEMLPAAAPFLKLKLHHNRADAVLLALWGSKQ